jgi:DNA-binding protein H-NS
MHFIFSSFSLLVDGLFNWKLAKKSTAEKKWFFIITRGPFYSRINNATLIYEVEVSALHFCCFVFYDTSHFDISQMILKLETITKEREMQMEKLWKEFQNVLNSYLKYTEEYRDEYIDLRNRDAEDTRSIQDHYNGAREEKFIWLYFTLLTNKKFISEVSKLTERITELKSQLINVKDEQDFNINQLIKHRNDLKLKMDRIKEDMENGLVDDKEKLKFLALMGSRVYKVCFFVAVACYL